MSTGAHFCCKPAHSAKSYCSDLLCLPCLLLAKCRCLAWLQVRTINLTRRSSTRAACQWLHRTELLLQSLPAGGVPELMWVLNQGSTPALSAAAALERLVTSPSGKHREAAWLSAVNPA